MSFEDDAAYYARRARKQEALAESSADFHAYCFHMRLVVEYERLRTRIMDHKAAFPAQEGGIGEIPSPPHLSDPESAV